MMKAVIVQENFAKACRSFGWRGANVLYAAIAHALDGEEPDFESDDWAVDPRTSRALYEAIAPVLADSVVHIGQGIEIGQGEDGR